MSNTFSLRPVWLQATLRPNSIKLTKYPALFALKAASHRIRLRLTIRLMANGSLHTCSVGRTRVNFLDFDRLPAYLKLFQVSWIASVVGDGVLAACGKTAVTGFCVKPLYYLYVGLCAKIVAFSKFCGSTACTFFFLYPPHRLFPTNHSPFHLVVHCDFEASGFLLTAGRFRC